MAITNFIPTIWSENLTRALDQEYIGVAHCNRDYEGEIKNCGSTVKICGVGSVSINDYTKNADMSMPQSLSDTVAELTINQAKYFNFQIDDIDRAQSTPKLMDAAMRVAAAGLAKRADEYVYNLCTQTSNNIFSDANSPDILLQSILEAREMLFNAGVTDSSQIVLEVSPALAFKILKAKLNTTSDTTDVLENGALGSIAGCHIYVSQNIPKTYNEQFSAQCMTGIMRTRRAVAFAEQLSEIEAYRPEKRFADAVKGLHLYGAALVYPNECVCLQYSEM